MSELVIDGGVRDASVAPTLISGDGHLEVTVEPWMKFVPQKYRDQAPRLVHLPDGGEGWVVEGMPMFHNGMNLSAGRTAVKLKGESYWEPDGSPAPGSGSPQQRLSEQDIDGVDAEVLYPPVFIRRCIEGISDRQVYLSLVRAYNEFLAEFCAVSPRRLIGNATIPITGIDDAVAELRHASGLGLPSVSPAMFPSGENGPVRGDDAFWETALELGMRVSPHGSLGSVGALNLMRSATASFDFNEALSQRASKGLATTLAHVINSGVFERLPELQIYIAETNASWLPYALYMMDDSYRLFQDYFGQSLKMLPSEYVWSHFHFGIVRDPLVVPMLDLLDPSRLIWGSDFPHSVGSWPNSRAFVDQTFEGVDPVIRDRIVRDNAVEFFGLGPSANVRER
jgi:uncharacterized protein